MYFDLWTLLVEQLIGGFWITVFCIIGVIFLIMAVIGKMSKWSVSYYLILFLMTMTLGFGYKWLTTLCGLVIFILFFREVQAAWGS